jgi:O-antigen/teichoic acid export membrane protein
MSHDPEPPEKDPADQPTPIGSLDPQLESYGEGPLTVRLVSFFKRDSVRKRLLAPLGADTLILVTNLVTGVIVARALGPSGRGELTAVLLVSQIAAWVFSMGNTEAISYYQSRHPELARALQSSWLLVTIPLTIISVIASELLLPALFAAQSDQALTYARIYMAIIPVVLLLGNFSGSILADEDFNYYNLTRFIAPAITATAYAVLWSMGEFSVVRALIANFVAMSVTVALLAWRSLRRHPLVMPDIPLLKKTMWYGLRAHAGSVGSIVNARLDLLIIPAFLPAASIGLYSVSTNVSSILPVLTGTVALMLLPVAARRRGSARTVIRTMQATMGIAFAIAVPIGILAPFAVKLIYGGGFAGAVEPLRLLLPGAVAQAGVTVLWSGLLAADRPFLASSAIVPAAIITIVSLIIFLPTYGINAAAIITTVVYVGEGIALAVLYRRTMRIRWRDYLRPPDDPPYPPDGANPEPALAAGPDQAGV